MELRVQWFSIMDGTVSVMAKKNHYLRCLMVLEMTIDIDLKNPSVFAVVNPRER
jgi:hypothetical protein